MKRIRLIITGDVQGVGYRSWTVRQARRLQLTGWVTNRPDKSVELVAEGTYAALEKFITLCRKGPEVAWVENVNVTWQEATGEFLSFNVIY